MNDAGEVFAEHFAELAFDLLLEVLLNDGDTVKGGANLDALQGIVFEDESNALCLGHDKHNNGTELDRREAEVHGDDERSSSKENAAGSGGGWEEANVGAVGLGERVGLDLGLEHKMSIASIGEAEDAAESVHSEVANLENLELRRDGAHTKFLDGDVVGNDLGLGTTVESAVEHLCGALMELVREGRPLEVERHGGLRV